MYFGNRYLLFIVLLIGCIFTSTFIYSQTLILRPGYSANHKGILQSGIIDTISNGNIDFNTLFELSGQDVIAGWFECPADLKIKACGYDCGENSALVQAELRIVKVNPEWSLEMLRLPGAQQLGWWAAEDSSILPFITGMAGVKSWKSVEGLTYPFSEEIWSDQGVGSPCLPVDDGDRSTYQWIEMNILGAEPELRKGDIFAVCMKNMDSAGTGNTFSILSSNEPGYGILKFYADGRTPGDYETAGWWQREFMPNMAVIAEITGDSPPVISAIDKLGTTLSVSERKVTAFITDENPSGGAAGIESASLQFFVNTDSVWTDIPMTETSPGLYEGTIPGQSPGTRITYRIKARDLLYNEAVSSETYSYHIFNPASGAKSLMVLNGFAEDITNKYIEENAVDYSASYDTWSYGPLVTELVNNYDNIFEITNSADAGIGIIYNDEVVRNWLQSGEKRNYALAGQEWLGARYGFMDRDFEPGTFEYDILGITHSYNDAADTMDSIFPSRLFAEQGSLICGELSSEFEKLNVDSLRYDPKHEIGIDNWIDGFEVLPGQQSDMSFETRNIKKELKKDTVCCITHRLLEHGNKIAFLSLDPMAINTSPFTPKYVNFGKSSVSPVLKIFQWFDTETGVRDSTLINSYTLLQNYPNPFNPATIIKYSIGKEGLVTLKVYNLLGEEVGVLINGYKKEGSYSVEFNAGGLSSGIYYYVLNSSNFHSVRKMILIK